MKLRIKNYLIEGFAEFLLTFELKGTQSLLRTRFVKLLNQQLELIAEEKKLLAQEHGDTNEDGSPKVEEKDGQQIWKLKEDNVQEFNKQFNELMNETFVIEVNENNLQMIEIVKDIVLNCEQTFSGQQALLYDEFCSVIESIEE